MNIQDEDVLAALNLWIDGIFIENTGGDILTCNQAGARMFGYMVEEMNGLNIRDLVPQEENYYLKSRYSKSDLFPDEYITRLNKKKDGTLIRTEINSKIITLSGKEYLVAFIRDASAMAGIDPRDRKLQELPASFMYSRGRENQIHLVLHDSVGRDRFAVPLTMVEHIESCLRKLSICLINGTIVESYDTVNHLWQKIPPNGSFLRCHQSFIVNLRYAKLDESLRVFVMQSGKRVPVRKRQYTQIKKAYYYYKIVEL